MSMEKHEKRVGFPYATQGWFGSKPVGRKGINDQAGTSNCVLLYMVARVKLTEDRRWVCCGLWGLKNASMSWILLEGFSAKKAGRLSNRYPRVSLDTPAGYRIDATRRMSSHAQESQEQTPCMHLTIACCRKSAQKEHFFRSETEPEARKP